MPPTHPTLVLTGATGFIGSRIASFFAAQNWNVIALARNIPIISKPQKTISNSQGKNSISLSRTIHLNNVLYSKYDLATEEEAIIPDDVDLFIHAGYIKNENGGDAFDLNIKSAERLMKTMKEKNIRQKLFLSSLSADKNALSVYGKQKAAIEEIFLNENGTVVRAGLVLGNGGLFQSMKTYLQKKKIIPLFGNGQQPLQTVYIDDLVDSIFKIAEKNSGGKFIVANDNSVPYRQFYSDLAASVDVRPKFLRLPFWMAEMGISTWKFFGMNLPVTKDNLLGLKRMKPVSSKEDLEKIGMKLRDYKESFFLLK